MAGFPIIIDARYPRHVSSRAGLPITPDDIYSMFERQNPDVLRPWKQMSSLLRDIGSTIKSDRAKFQINLDVQHFAPEEISVKTADGFIVIEARHDEKQDEHGWVSRQFTRRYPLPEGCCAEAVESRLSSDGVLTVIAPLVQPQTPNERLVPIIPTGPVKTQPEGWTSQMGEGESFMNVAPVSNGQ